MDLQRKLGQLFYKLSAHLEKNQFHRYYMLINTNISVSGIINAYGFGREKTVHILNNLQHDIGKKFQGVFLKYYFISLFVNCSFSYPVIVNNYGKLF